MEGIYGVALLSASVLLLAFMAKYRNGTSAPEWVKSGAVLQTVLFTTVAGFVFAISMLIQFAVNLKTEHFGLNETGLLVAVVAVSWVSWVLVRKMPAGTPLSPVGPTDSLPPAANANGPSLRTGRKGARKAA